MRLSSNVLERLAKAGFNIEPFYQSACPETSHSLYIIAITD